MKKRKKSSADINQYQDHVNKVIWLKGILSILKNILKKWPVNLTTWRQVLNDL